MANTLSEFNSPNDGREPGDWKTRYPEEDATKAINWEKRYLIILLAVFLTLPLIIGLYICGCFCTVPKTISNSFPLLKTYAFGWMGGMLGGIVFAMKWLYHSVAKNIWNRDRQLWRIFTPHLSGALALGVIILMNSKTLIASEHAANFHKAYGVGFLIGYFSDNAIGKMTELANVLFSTKK